MKKLHFCMTYYSFHLYINRECNFKEKKKTFLIQGRLLMFSIMLILWLKISYLYISSQDLNQKTCESITTILILPKEEKL